jgi:hypothetical protein
MRGVVLVARRTILDLAPGSNIIGRRVTSEKLWYIVKILLLVIFTYLPPRILAYT